jgi:hypothetical protein
MAAGRKVGEVYYEVTADNQVHRGLAAAEGEIQAFKSAVDATDARIEVEADLKQLAKDLAEAKAMAAAMEAEKIELSIEGDTDGLEDLDHALENTRRNIKVLQQQQIIRKEEITRIRTAEKALQGNRLEVAKLKEQYAKLYTQIQKVQKIDRFRTTQRETIMLERLNAELDQTSSRLRAMGHDTRDLDVDLNRNAGLLQRMITGLTETRVHLGFFSTTLKGLGGILVTLGPVILSVMGSVAALASVLGAGIFGAAAAGSAALTGFGLAAAGIFGAVQPFMEKAGQQFTDVFDRFQKGASAALKEPFFDTVAEGVKTANALLPIFQDETIKTGKVAAKGFQEWIRGMRSPEAQDILGDIMGNFRRGLPALMDGFGSLGAAFGRITQAASHFLPTLNRGFAQWAQNLEESIGGGDQLQQRVGRWIDAMQKLGHFTQAGASALGTFFSIGLGPGKGFLDSMTRSLGRWNQEMKRNPEPVREFFQDSIDLMQQLGPAFGRALMTLAHAAQAFAPAVQGAATVLNQLFDVVSEIPSAFLTAAGGIWVVNRALRALTGISVARGALALLFGGAAGGAAGRAGGGLLGGILGGAAGGTAARQMALFGGRTAAATALLNPFTAAALAAGAGVFFLSKALIKEDDNLSQSNAALTAFNSSSLALPRAQKRAAAGVQQANNALSEYNKLAKAGNATAKDQSRAANQIATGVNRQAEAQEQARFEMEKQKSAMTALRDATNDQRQAIDNMTKSGRASPPVMEAARSKLAEVSANLRIATLNYNRLRHGAELASKGMLQSLGAIKGIAGRQTALKFRFDDENVVRGVSRLSQRLTGLGRRQQVIKILADSKNADQAIIRLQGLLNRVKDKNVKVNASTATAERGAESVRAAIERIRDKMVQIRQSGAQSAMGQVAALRAQIDALQSKTVTLTTVHVTRGVPSVGAPAGIARYAGGVHPPGYQVGGAVDKMMERAFDRADRRAGIRSDRGAAVSSPRYVVGEEGPRFNEFIITDNPAYRRSNQRYLADAASALGMMLIPGFAKGKGKKKKHRKPGENYDSFEYDIPQTPYDVAHDTIQLLEDTFGVWRRAYDLKTAAPGLGRVPTLDDLGGNIFGQIGQWQLLMSTIIPKLLRSPDKELPKVPKGKLPKGDKARDREKRRRENIQNRRQEASQYNKDKGTAFESLRDEMQSIPGTISNLQLDLFELQNAAATDTILGTQAANQQIFDAFTQFSGNVSGFGQALTSGFAPPLSPGTASFFPSASMGALSPGVMGGFASLGAPSSGGAPSPTAGGVTIVNNFATTPPDPLTWSQGTMFELSAL